VEAIGKTLKVTIHFVIPAQVGNQKCDGRLDSRFRGNDKLRYVIVTAGKDGAALGGLPMLSM